MRVVLSLLASVVIVFSLLFVAVLPPSSMPMQLVDVRHAQALPVVMPSPTVAVSPVLKPEVLEVAPVPEAKNEVYKCKENGHITYSSTPCASGRVPYDAGRASFGESSVGSASISRDAGGVYRAKGSVNGQSEDFIIDTGASMTTLSGGLAYRLGVQNCTAAGIVNTANGKSSFCLVKVAKLTVAGFSFSNISVAVNPGLTGLSLFGNDLLSQFAVSHRNGVMTLSR